MTSARASGVSSLGMISPALVTAAVPGPSDQANRSGRPVTQRPHRMQRPWSTRSPPWPVTLIAPVGHSPAASTAAAAPARPARIAAGPRVAAAYSSGRDGHRVVTTPLRSPRNAHIGCLLPRRAGNGHAEARLDEREIGEDVAREHLVHQHQVVKRGRPDPAPGDPPVLNPHVIEQLALGRLGPAWGAAGQRFAVSPQRAGAGLG